MASVDVDKSAILPTQPQILNTLDRYVSEDQLRQLKLIFVLSHLAHDCDIEKSKLLLSFRDLLLSQSDKWIQERAIPLIQSILSIINVRKDEVEKLGSPHDVLEECKTFLSYPRAVIEVCKSLTTDEFQSFKTSICADHLEYSADNIKNCEDLFLKLHHQKKISEEAEGFRIILPYLSGRKDIQEKLTRKSIKEEETLFVQETITKPVTQNDTQNDTPLNGINNDGNISQDSDSTENQPLIEIVPVNNSAGETFFERHKKLLKYSSVIAVVSIVSAATVFFGVGGYMYVKQSTLIVQNTINMTSFAVGGDIIVLGMVNADVISRATVEASPVRDDSAHVSKVYLTSSNKLQKNVTNCDKDYIGYYFKNPKRTSVQDSRYLLDTSLIEYKFCAANPHEGTGEAHAYIFNDEKNYSDYAGQQPGSEAHFYLFRQTIEVGTFNNTVCTPFNLSIEESAYYFVAIDTPSDIYYNYTYRIKDVHLDKVDYSVECEQLDEDNPCNIDLSDEDGLHYVLASVNPNVDHETRTTHLRLLTSGLSSAVRYCWIVAIALLVVGGVCFLLLVFLSCLLVIYYRVIVRKRSQHSIV